MFRIPPLSDPEGLAKNAVTLGGNEEATKAILETNGSRKYSFAQLSFS